MSKLMNFTIKLAELKGDKRWGYLQNGNWTGGIARALYEGDADIGVCNMWYTLSTYQIMNFGHPLNEVGMRLGLRHEAYRTAVLTKDL